MAQSAAADITGQGDVGHMAIGASSVHLAGNSFDARRVNGILFW